MSKNLTAVWMPTFHHEITGLSRYLGSFWITRDGDEHGGCVVVKMTVPAEGHREQGFFASISVHYDGIKILRDLDDFLNLFEEIEAQTVYDVFQCLVRCGILVISHDTDPELVPNRKWYELVHGENT